jgi:Arm DNA-binding domain
MAERYRTQAYFDRLSLPAGETDKTFYDDKVTGLGLRFRAEGKPKWTLYYQRQGRQRRYAIGPRSLKLEAAREAAQMLQADVAKGVKSTYRRGRKPSGPRTGPHQGGSLMTKWSAI